jgi:BASS family bile acid:Na+ symporter
VALVGQIVLLPLLAGALIVALRLPPAVSAGLVLVAAAPQAISSNFLCLLARADIALSVTLTAVSSVLAVVVTPLVAGAMFALLLEQEAGFSLPVLTVLRQVATGLLLPVAAGMLVRHHAPAFVQRNQPGFQRLNVAMLGLVLGAVLVDQAQTIRDGISAIAYAAVLFTLGAAALGFGTAKLFAWNREDSVTLIAAFASRSLGISALIAVNVLGRPDFLSFAVIFFFAQAGLLAPAMLLARR